MKHLFSTGLVSLLALSAACSNSSNPMSPSATGIGSVSAVPEGTPTLKANTPSTPEPASGATTELGPSNTIPVTLSVTTATATHANTVTLGHRFQLFEGTTLIAEGMGLHVPKGYIYAAMAFSVFVEILNLKMRSSSEKPVELRDPERVSYEAELPAPGAVVEP